jgi:hypothetical protein
MQSVAISTNVVSSNPARGEVYSIQQYVIKVTCCKYSGFNNISELCIVAVIFIGGRNPEYLQQVTFITYCCIEYTSPRAGFELTTLVEIATDCIGSCKSNYYKITTTTAPVGLYINGKLERVTSGGYDKKSSMLNSCNTWQWLKNWVPICIV